MFVACLQHATHALATWQKLDAETPDARVHDVSHADVRAPLFVHYYSLDNGLTRSTRLAS